MQVFCSGTGRSNLRGAGHRGRNRSRPLVLEESDHLLGPESGVQRVRRDLRTGPQRTDGGRELFDTRALRHTLGRALPFRPCWMETGGDPGASHGSRR